MIRTPPALTALMTKSIDYAGMFPPAGLKLDEAVATFAAHTLHPESWMLSRFIAKVSDLEKAELGRLPKGTSLSVLGIAGGTTEDFVRAVSSDNGEILAFNNRRRKKQIQADVMEFRLPPDIETTDQAYGLAKTVAERLTGIRIYYELDPKQIVDNREAAIIEGLAQFIERGGSAGLKLRTGGVRPEAFPSTERVAFTICQAYQRCVPIKFTAGLHHPIRHYNDTVGTKMHGFLNVLGGAVMAHILNFSQQTLQEILEDEDPSHFVFDGDRFAWTGGPQSLSVELNYIMRARAEFAVSFGSCSFIEPRDDLATLGLLPRSP